MRGLDGVIDFPARDMTITVQAGITIAKLQALLAPENLRLPIDVPEPERATLGGILATNVSGPRRYGYGTLRDYVIGISAVNDEGNEFKAGASSRMSRVTICASCWWVHWARSASSRRSR